jgi:beta-N-acetylhexosaminidase
MIKTILTVCLLGSVSFAGAQNAQVFTLQDYYSDNPELHLSVDRIYANLNPHERVAQMIVTSLGKLGKPYEAVRPLLEQRRVGGIIFLSGETEAFKSQIQEINQLSSEWPLIMSMDAEPSLFNRRIAGTPVMKPTSELATASEISEVVEIIDSVLHYVGFHQNFAPVVDLSNQNEAIGNRTFGADQKTVVPKAIQFISETQEDQIVATAKHFPGHGRVAGDTHKKLVYINGDLTEAAIYKDLINNGVLSIMVGHIAVENNKKYDTDGLPSTLSPVIVTDLLRNEMGFRGLIITDAMNMGAVSEIPEACSLAAKAGCDMILMPPDENETIESILRMTYEDEAFQARAEESIKRIIRLKLCLGMRFSQI